MGASVNGCAFFVAAPSRFAYVLSSCRDIRQAAFLSRIMPSKHVRWMPEHIISWAILTRIRELKHWSCCSYGLISNQNVVKLLYMKRQRFDTIACNILQSAIHPINVLLRRSYTRDYLFA